MEASLPRRSRARVSAEMREARLILRHAETDWRAAAWMLERRNPDRYGRNPVQSIRSVSADTALPSSDQLIPAIKNSLEPRDF